MLRQQFSGLTMPVFSAFGWAGEDAALNYALSQLELFIGALQLTLPKEGQILLPHAGLDRAGNSVYLAVSEPPENSAFVAFYARPTSLEIALTVTDRRVLNRLLKVADADPESWRRLMLELGPDWTLRIQQMEVDEEAGTTAHYQDLYKDSVEKLDEDTAATLASRAAFLNADPKWTTPIYLSKRLDSEQAAAMGSAVLRIMSDEVVTLFPLIRYATGQSTKSRTARPKTRAARAGKSAAEAAPAVEIPKVAPGDQFEFASELQPLHLRRGFINLTPYHWPFFELNARTETRPVVVHFEGRYDRNSAVWRLVPDDQARVMLGPQAREWLEDNFNPNDKILVTATRLDGHEIQLTLQPVEE